MNNDKRKWIHYEDYSFEPVNPDENINAKKHTPNRRWFVVDKDKDWRPNKLAPEAFHPRHKPSTAVPDMTMPTFVVQQKKTPSDLRKYPTTVAVEKDKEPEAQDSLRGKSFAAAVDMSTGKVRMLDNGFDPNVPNARDIQEKEREGQRPHQKPQQPSSRNTAKDAREMEAQAPTPTHLRPWNGKHGGVDRTPEPPRVPPAGVLGSVEYYKWRAEDFERRNPGKKAPPYYRDYGDKYVRRFTEELRPNLTPQGQQWLDKTKLLLQQKIDQGLANGTLNEHDPVDFKSKTFDMHSEAYLEAGISGLPWGDLWQIGTQPEIKEWMSLDTYKEAAETGFPIIDAKNPYPYPYGEVDEMLDMGPYIPWQKKYTRLTLCLSFLRQGFLFTYPHTQASQASQKGPPLTRKKRKSPQSSQ